VPSNTDLELTRLFFDNPRVENIAELLQRTRGMATGVVSTVSVADSTPASFSSHSFSRFAQAAIAEQMISSSGHAVILGAGARFFVPAGNSLLGNIPTGRADTRNLVEESRKAGYAFVSSAIELQQVGRPQKLLGLFHPADMAGRFDRMMARKGNAGSIEAVRNFPDQPDLELMTQRAIEILSQYSSGFFLMVEAGSIDREYHRLDPYRAIFETIELDNAIAVARSWARQQGNDTLIIVTSDHETAGLALTGVLENGRINGRAFPTYTDTDRDGFPDDPLPSRGLLFDFASTFRPADGNHYYEAPRNLMDLNPGSDLAAPPPQAAGHTATDVFIAASGPGSHLFGGVMDNTEVFFRMLRAAGYNR
jgi:alkaline phosphatase